MNSDSWTHLKRHTAARIALGRSGGSLPTNERLQFQMAVARARDAVLTPFDPPDLVAQLAALPLTALVLASNARDRATFLRRPDLGRQLAEHSRAELETVRVRGPWDLVIVISDGLSALATQRQALPVLGILVPQLLAAGWQIAPLCVVANARVALQDEIGATLGAGLSLMLLGERPGLGSPDSLGAYFTYRPAPGKTDAQRNCISNIRPEGLKPELAAERLFYLLGQARRLKLSGVGLKDDAGGGLVGWGTAFDLQLNTGGPPTTDVS